MNGEAQTSMEPGRTRVHGMFGPGQSVWRGGFLCRCFGFPCSRERHDAGVSSAARRLCPSKKPSSLWEVGNIRALGATGMHASTPRRGTESECIESDRAASASTAISRRCNNPLAANGPAALDNDAGVAELLHMMVKLFFIHFDHISEHYRPFESLLPHY